MGPETWKKVPTRGRSSRSTGGASLGSCFWFFCSVFCLACSWPAWSTDTAANGPSATSGNELSRLLEISSRLASLNERLESELTASKLSSEELARSLESSRIELDALRIELEASRSISSGLASSAERSETESTELKAALGRAESSLRSSEASFAVYRTAAEDRIARLERSSSFFRAAAGVAAAFAASGWAAFLALLLL